MRNAIWLFVMFYGATFAIGTESSTSDITRHIAEMKKLHHIQMGIGSAWQYYWNSYHIDVVHVFVKIILSRFTDNGYFLPFIYCTIFGYFFANNITFVFKKVKNKSLTFVIILLMICLFLVAPIWQINGIRFITASHAFLYGLLPYLFEEKSGKCLIWCFLSPILFHFSFLFPVGILIIYLVFGNRLFAFYIFFLASLFINK